MKQRSELIEWVRGEVVGASRCLTTPGGAGFREKEFTDTVPARNGPLTWRPSEDTEPEEVLYFEGETPHRKYGVGLLHPLAPETTPAGEIDAATEVAVRAADTLGVDLGETEPEAASPAEDSDESEAASMTVGVDDFDISSPDVRHPTTLGISFCVRVPTGAGIVIRLPQRKLFEWQAEDSSPFPLNGRYEKCSRKFRDNQGRDRDQPMWRRWPAVAADCQIPISASELIHGKKIWKPVSVSTGCPLALAIEVFPRRLADELWLMTIVLRNASKPGPQQDAKEYILYQTYFEVAGDGAVFEQYPESERPFSERDLEEQSLALLYREAATWAIGHGCAAGWGGSSGATPEAIFADVFPAVELPSVTADIRDSDGSPLQLSMRGLSELPDEGVGGSWSELDSLASRYDEWIFSRQNDVVGLPEEFRPVAEKHLGKAVECHRRIIAGISLLRSDPRVRRAFRLANEAMLLQQTATKAVRRRQLVWNSTGKCLALSGPHESPLRIVSERREGSRVGSWRAFQIAFLLMSLDGVTDGTSDEREVVDLIWFPTGGGKTEAYMGVIALHLFHERLLVAEGGALRRDGTNALMRYTLRMLTTQQFQRAAALICSMEVLRRRENQAGSPVAGGRFSLGLWIGSEGSPNKAAEAITALGRYRKGSDNGNPLVITECPWCRAQIGRYDGTRPASIREGDWVRLRLRGISEIAGEGPLLHCSDPDCAFGGSEWKHWLPVEVIDERIYRNPPSLVIATADKFAMIAYRPQAGALFGRHPGLDGSEVFAMPPSLIIQDELHLISGPLGTMYALYEGVIERLCTFDGPKGRVKPKVIASTATIRGADDQVIALYDRPEARLFPSPGLSMGDSFFGVYAKDDQGRLKDGRLYLGIHATDYGSILTTQVRAFSSLAFRPYSLPEDQRDPWWTLLVFYNSIRELGGAKTLFDSDIRSRLKFMFNREGFTREARRTLRIVEELTSRLSQAEIVRMMDSLSRQYEEGASGIIDACLASNIIEVGVDIDRLSVMGVVGQPKTTAQYIQVTGRVGRRWDERPGLIVTIYNPSKSRDRSHFEQFHSYHRRLYERVEPTTATPFAVSAIQRGLPGALLTWARQQSAASVDRPDKYQPFLDEALDLLLERCANIQSDTDAERSLREIKRVFVSMKEKWQMNPLEWEEYPPRRDGEYLMLWPGQFATKIQKRRGMVVASSMRQVDGSAELRIVPVDS